VATAPQDFTIRSTATDIVLKTGDDIFFNSNTLFTVTAPTQLYRAPVQQYTTNAGAVINSATTYVTGTTVATTAADIVNTLTGNTYFDAATSMTLKSTGSTFSASFTRMNLETTGVSSTVNLVAGKNAIYSSSAASDVELTSTGAMVLQNVGVFTVDTASNVNLASPLGRTDLFASSSLSVSAQTGTLTFTSNGRDSTNNAGIFVNALNAVAITAGTNSNITINSQESTSFETQGSQLTLTATAGDIELDASGSQQDIIFRGGTVTLTSQDIFSRAASLLDVHAAGAINVATTNGDITMSTFAPFSNLKLAADRFDKDDGQPGLLRWTSTNSITTSSAGSVFFKTNDAGGELGLGTLRFDSTNGFNFAAVGGNVEFIARSAAVEGKATAVTLTTSGAGRIQMQAARRVVSTSTGATTITNTAANLFPIDSYHGDILVRGGRASANSINARGSMLFQVTEPGDENDLLLTSAGAVDFITGFTTMTFRSLGSKGSVELRNNDGPNTVSHAFQGQTVRHNARGGQSYLTQGGNPNGNDIQLTSGNLQDIVMQSRGAYETLLYTSEGNVIMNRPASRKIQVRNYQSRLGFFSYRPVIIQPIGVQYRETCEYYSACRVPEGIVDFWGSNVAPIYFQLEQRLNFIVDALVDYGLLEYKQGFL